MELFFNKNQKKIIGMIHLAPLLGYSDHPGFEQVKNKAIQDLQILTAGKIDAVMIENNYDIPHYEKVLTSTRSQLDEICQILKSKTNLPVGLSLLWNDYEYALELAKKYNLQFIRVPVFVDKVKTEYGIFNPKAKEFLQCRKKIKADKVLIFADIQVKHATHLIKRPIQQTAIEAIQMGADALIITGKWTGDAPTFEDVDEVKKITKEIPIILGSGITPENINKYNVDAAIVGTYFKNNESDKKHHQNIYPWQAKLDLNKVRSLMIKTREN